MRVTVDTSKNVAKPRKVDDAYLQAEPLGHHHAAISHFLRDTVRVVIKNVSGVQECVTRQVQFLSVTSPDPSKSVELEGQWTGNSCHVAFFWRLGDLPGDQLLIVRLKRDTADSVTQEASGSTSVTFGATAYTPSTLVIGGAWVAGGLHGISDTANIKSKSRQVQPIVGYEFPLHPLPIESDVLDHFRVLAATSLRDFGADVYLGFEVGSLLNGPRAGDFPLQLSFGERIGITSKGNFFIALHLNGIGAIQAALGAITKL